MLHAETVEAGTLALIRKLSSDPILANFVLVGGTALALQLGHRKSIDIDLFSRKPFAGPTIDEHLRNNYATKQLTSADNSITGYLSEVKATLIAHQYDWIRRPENVEGIRMASLDDIAAMKLNAVVGSGKRLKDFVDVYFLLEHRSMQEMTDAYLAKYPGVNASVARNALLYHKQIDFGVDMGLKEALKFAAVRERLVEAMVEPRKVFKMAARPAEGKKAEEKKEGLGRKRGR